MRKRVEQGTTTERGQKNWNKNFWQTLVIELSKCQTLRGYFCYFFPPSNWQILRENLKVRVIFKLCDNWKKEKLAQCNIRTLPVGEFNTWPFAEWQPWGQKNEPFFARLNHGRAIGRGSETCESLPSDVISLWVLLHESVKGLLVGREVYEGVKGLKVGRTGVISEGRSDSSSASHTQEHINIWNTFSREDW